MKEQINYLTDRVGFYTEETKRLRERIIEMQLLLDKTSERLKTESLSLVIGVFEPSDEEIIKVCEDYMVYEWGYDRNDLHSDTGIRYRLMREFKWILKRIKEAQK